MIRRPVEHEAAGPWWCISQPDHAVLAGALARAFQAVSRRVLSNPQSAPHLLAAAESLALPFNDVRLAEGTQGREWGQSLHGGNPLAAALVAAIDHHDDGWADWEQRPHLDAESGSPRDFTEMDFEDSARIWSASVAICEQFSPLAAAWVSRHFCWLAERVLAKEPSRSPHAMAAQKFLTAQRQQQFRWLTAADPAVPDERPGTLSEQDLIRLETGFRWVQYYDLLSLKLCLTPAETGFEIAVPSGFTLNFTPAPVSADAGVTASDSSQSPPEIRWRVAQWIEPAAPPICVSVPARLIMKSTFESSAEFTAALAMAPVRELRWVLLPAM